jgi:hypothetical protein
VRSNPVNFNDPTGHFECNDPYGCDGPDDDNAESGSGGGGGGGDGNNDDDDEDVEDELQQDSCTYHLCSEDANLYETGWENFDQAWSIWTNPNASYGQRYGAGAYMGYWGGIHVAGAVGLAGLVCVASGGACVTAVEGTLGISAAGTQVFGSNPNAGISIFGFTEDLAIYEGQGVNILQNVKNYTWTGTNVPFMEQAMARGDTIVFVSNHLDDITRTFHQEVLYFENAMYPVIELFTK